MKKRITLAIETAIGNGSLSLFENERLLDARAGKEKISRSDRLLPSILEFLNENKIKKEDLSLIAVSLGPGSYTGARIGLATAIGLKNGLNVPCAGMSLWQALALTAANPGDNSLIIALLTNDDKVIGVNSKNINDFENDSIELGEQTLDDFMTELISLNRQTEIVVDRKLLVLIKDADEMKNQHSNRHSLLKFKPIEDDLSTYIGKAVLIKHGSDNVVNNLRVFYSSSKRNIF